MIVKLLTEHHLEFLSLTGCCIGSSESTLVKMPHCWKSHVTVKLLSTWNTEGKKESDCIVYKWLFPVQNTLIYFCQT